MPLRVLVVDDTVLYRKLVSDIVASIPDTHVSGTAANGEIALAALANTPADLVLLDVQMPVMDGLEALRQIKKRFPSTEVVMVSGVSTECIAVTIQALRLGALEFIRKPQGPDALQNADKIRAELEPIIRLLLARNPASPAPQTAPAPLALRKIQPPAEAPAMHIVPGKISVVAIGVSTGGPTALHTLLPGIPADFPVPILIVQHMPELFTAALAGDLSRKSSIKVVEAEEGLGIRPGTAILAKGGQHMVARCANQAYFAGINQEPPENSCRPSVDVLFRSVANCFGDSGVLAIVLTGMGVDGVAGVRALKRKSCWCITQSQASCVVYGMPRSVVEAGLSDEALDIGDIAPRMIALACRTNFCGAGKA